MRSVDPDDPVYTSYSAQTIADELHFLPGIIVTS